MSKCKTKAVRTNLGTFRHNQTYPGIIPAYSGIFRALCYPDIFKTVVYPEPAYSQTWYIQNPGIFRKLTYSKSEAYSEPCQTSTMKRFEKIVTGIIVFTNGNYFRKACRVLYFMK